MATYRTRTAKDGTQSVQVQVRMAGHPPQGATFPNKREAEKWAKTIEAAMIEGRHFRGTEGRKRTLGEAIDRWRAEILPRMKNGAMYGFTLDWWKDNHGTRKVGEVSRGWLADQRLVLLQGKFQRATPGSKRSQFTVDTPAEFFRDLPEGKRVDITVKGEVPQYVRTPATVNRYMAALSSVFGHVCGDWEWLYAGANPFTGLSKLPEGKAKGKAYADEARARLLQETAKDPQLHVLTLVALSTAARAGELLGLTWSHVQFVEAEGTPGERGYVPECARLLFENTKNGEDRVAWLYGEALEAMKAHRDRADMRDRTILHTMNSRGMTPDGKDGRSLSLAVFPGRWSHKHQRYGRYDYLPRLNKALAAAGIAGMRKPFHALRHTAATNLARMGANAHQLKALGGWKSDAVNVYVHMAAQDTKELAQRLQSKLTHQGETK
jgi:integrase